LPVPPVLSALSIRASAPRSWTAYAVQAWLLETAGNIPLIGLLCVLTRFVKLPEYPDHNMDASFLIGAVVIGPLVETVLLGALLTLLGIFTARPRLQAAGSAVIWGLAHALLIGWPAVVTAWGFFVMSWVWVSVRPISYARALAVTAFVHGLTNALVFGLAMIAK